MILLKELNPKYAHDHFAIANIILILCKFIRNEIISKIASLFSLYCMLDIITHNLHIHYPIFSIQERFVIKEGL